MGDDAAAAARTGAPHAEQVADRFHLLLNAGDVLERYLTRQCRSLREAVHTLNAVYAPRRSTKRTPADVRRRQERRAVRVARYERMVALAQEGVSARQIAEEVGVAPAPVYRYLAASSFPEHFCSQRPRHIDPYIPFLQERWNAG